MEKFEKTTQINLFGTLFVAKYAAAYMSKNKPYN